MPNSTTRKNQHQQQRRFASQPTSDIDFNNKTRSTTVGDERLAMVEGGWDPDILGNKHGG